MPFISISDELKNKSFTAIENKFITKYLPILEPMAVKVYLFSLYLLQNGNHSYTLTDLSKSLSLTEEEAQNYFEYLEEFELISILSLSPFEIKILDCENYSSMPKKFKAEKYTDFTKSVQNILKGRMISTNEFREYFLLLEEYGFEQNALVMIVNYCVSLKGDDIRFPYIRKVAKSFYEDGATTVEKVNDKLSAYTSSTPILVKLFSQAGIKKQPDVDDDKLYSKWTNELGFLDDAIVSAAKLFKCRNTERLDLVLEELFKNKKFDTKEIDDYCKNKNSLFVLAQQIGKALGLYIQNAATYVENYISPWCNMGFTFDGLKKIATYQFKQSKNSFEDMNDFIATLYNDGVVSDVSLDDYFAQRTSEDNLIKEILSQLGLSRKIITWDRECLKKWKSWNFSNDMLFEAAKISAGKSNPAAYMNGVLSSWKNDGIFSVDKIIKLDTPTTQRTAQNAAAVQKDIIERHFYDLQNAAERRADENLARATGDPVYGDLHKKINDLNIRLAFAEIKDRAQADKLEVEIGVLEKMADERLGALGLSKADLEPNYSCKMCNDTGYTKDGKPCNCMKEFIKTLN